MSDAVKYFQKNGLEASKQLVEMGFGFCSLEGDLSFHTEQLKQLVESWELVELFDDLNCAKVWVSDLDYDWPYQVKGSDNKFFRWQLEQAIADAERLEVGNAN